MPEEENFDQLLEQYSSKEDIRKARKEKTGGSFIVYLA